MKLANPIRVLLKGINEACSGTGYTIGILFQTFSNLRLIHKKWSQTVNYLFMVTIGSMPVTFIVGMFTGMILALQIGLVLRDYGQEARVGSVVAASLVREMGPIMTAFAMAGLIGSTIASELGTMKVSEEIDALEVMSINPVYYLVLPRAVALTLATIIMTIYTDIIGIIGGYIVGAFIIGLDQHTYFKSAQDILQFRDLYGGVLKSAIFGITISTIAASQGLRAENGAEGVGRATLHSVVISFIFILMFNYFLTWAIYY